jgi:hypothetical protein
VEKENSLPFADNPDEAKRRQRIELVFREASFTAPPQPLPANTPSDRDLHTFRLADPRRREPIHTDLQRNLAIDVPVTSPYSGTAPAMTADGASSSTVAGLAAARVVPNKAHYTLDMSPQFCLRTAAFETHGMPGRMARHVVELLAEEVVRRKGFRKGFVVRDIWQRLSVALQRGMADRIRHWSQLHAVPDVAELAVVFPRLALQAA